MFEHPIRSLRRKQDWLDRNGWPIRHNLSELLRNALCVTEVGDHKLGQTCQQLYRLREISLARRRKVEKYRHVVLSHGAQLLPYRIQDLLPLFGETPKDKNNA